MHKALLESDVQWPMFRFLRTAALSHKKLASTGKYGMSCMIKSTACMDLSVFLNRGQRIAPKWSALNASYTVIKFLPLYVFPNLGCNSLLLEKTIVFLIHVYNGLKKYWQFYFYGKINKMHQCIKCILFRNDTLHVSDGLSVHHHCQTNNAVCLLASTQQYLFDNVCCCM